MGIRMKEKWGFVVLLILCSMVYGCGQTNQEASLVKEQETVLQEKQDESNLSAAEVETGMQQDKTEEGPGTEIQQAENHGEDEIELVHAQKVEPFAPENEEGRTLTEEELRRFDEFIRRQDNYGFLLSVYDTPVDVDLDEILYCGAGIPREQATEEEIEAYLHACGWDEVYTDFEKLTTEQIDTFLQKKTGLSYEQMNSHLKWTYLPEYDAYYSEHGDTNYRAFSCVEGYTVDEKIFTLRCRPIEMGEPDVDGYHVMDYELVLEKYDEEYQFRSNRLMWEQGLIAEQSFLVHLEPLGDVIFASYEPDTETDPLADASFFILRDGEELRRLKGTFDRNIRESEVFHAVEAVAFADYNRDGNTDIIIITDYSSASGAEDGAVYPEIRLYEGKNEYLYYDEEMSEAVNIGTEEKTIRAVTHFIGGAALWKKQLH